MMKLKILMYPMLLFSFLLLSSSASETINNDGNDKAEDKYRYGELVKQMIQQLSTRHYSPHSIDDDFSAKVFDLYIENLDRNKRFFIKSDYDKLVQHKDKIDDEINSASADLLEQSIEIIEKRVKEAESYYKDLLAEPFDFSIDENVEFDADKIDFVADKTALKERWRKWLKYQTLTRLAETLEKQEKAKEEGKKDVEEKSYATLEKEAREKVLKNHDSWFKRMAKLDKSDRINTFINSLTAAYDPHTGYYPPKDKEDFDIHISGRLEGIGARLTEKDGYIKVTEIIPGSPSWKQGKLAPEDLILKVAQAEEEPIDVVDMKLSDAVQLIRGKKGTEVRLTVKKVDGSTTIIPIIRDVVIIEEGYAKSVRLEEEGDSGCIGYIKLPRFYVDFNNSGDGRNCAEDIAREIIKLQDEGIEGLILDLRNNGGGSLNEVVDMVDMFIEEGPVVQVKSRRGRPTILPERSNPSILYDEPLVVLVNSFSASASEILAAALQDYGRAVIVGSESTFGKGTVQRFLPLDENPYTTLPEESLGAVKMTIQKFYRINGGTNQLTGVQPDIVLPNAYSYIDIGEKEQKYAMPWDEITPARYNKWKGLRNMKKIKQESEKRVAKNETFQLIEENAQRMKEKRDKTSYTLCLDKYKKEQEENKAITEKYEDIKKEIDDLQIHSLQTDLAQIKTDSTKQKLTEEWHEELKKDVYVFEAMEIVKSIK